MANYCPKCGHGIDTQSNFECSKCGEKFWESKEDFSKRQIKRTPELKEESKLLPHEKQPNANGGKYCKFCGDQNISKAVFCKKCGKSILKKKFQWFPRKRYKLLFLLPIVIALIIYYINSGSLSSYVDIYPFWPTDPKTTTLTCPYAGKSLKTDVVLYGNINKYYQGHDYSNRKTYLKNGQFGKFVYANPKDNTIKNLVSDIRKIASSNLLSEDQTLELAGCFIQNISYDNDKANLVLKQTGNSPDTEQYPYQTLYSNKGICTDKTYLGSALLRELGYGTGILAFDENQHMALGVTAPGGYTSFNSKYVYMEMTEQYPPGLIPSDIDATNGLPISFVKALQPLNERDSPDLINFNYTKTISAPTVIVDINTGKSYSRIVTVRNLEKTIGDSISSLGAKKADLQRAYGNISYYDNRQSQAYSAYLAEPATTQTCYPTYSFYPSYLSRQNCYTSTNYSKSLKYSTYTMAFNSYKNAIANYNNLVNDYNNTLTKINKDINTYQTYQY